MARKSGFEETGPSPLLTELARTRLLCLRRSERAMAGAAARAAVALTTIAFWLWLLAGGQLESVGLRSVPPALLTALAYVSGVFLAVLVGPKANALLHAAVARKAHA